MILILIMILVGVFFYAFMAHLTLRRFKLEDPEAFSYPNHNESYYAGSFLWPFTWLIFILPSILLNWTVKKMDQMKHKKIPADERSETPFRGKM